MADSSVLLEVIVEGKNIKLVQRDIEELGSSVNRASMAEEKGTKSKKKSDAQNKKGISSLIDYLNKYNIESRPLWKPMHLQPLYKNKQFFGGKIEEELFQKGLCLPSGSNLTLQEKDRIQNTILSFLDQ